MHAISARGLARCKTFLEGKRKPCITKSSNIDKCLSGHIALTTDLQAFSIFARPLINEVQSKNRIIFSGSNVELPGIEHRSSFKCASSSVSLPISYSRCLLNLRKEASCLLVGPYRNGHCRRWFPPTGTTCVTCINPRRQSTP